MAGFLLEDKTRAAVERTLQRISEAAMRLGQQAEQRARTSRGATSVASATSCATATTASTPRSSGVPCSRTCHRCSWAAMLALSGLEAAGRTLTGRELARRLSDDRHRRTDDFTFDRTAGLLNGRQFGTFTISIDGQRYAVRVPSSLFAYIHGRTDPENKRWMAEPR